MFSIPSIPSTTDSLIILCIAILSIISNSIAISSMNDDASKKYKETHSMSFGFVVFMLVISIFIALGCMGVIGFSNFTPAGRALSLANSFA